MYFVADRVSFYICFIKFEVVSQKAHQISTTDKHVHSACSLAQTTCSSNINPLRGPSPRLAPLISLNLPC